MELKRLPVDGDRPVYGANDLTIGVAAEMMAKLLYVKLEKTIKEELDKGGEIAKGMAIVKLMKEERARAL